MPPKKKKGKKVKFPFTEAQLAEAGLVGEGLSAEVRGLIEHMRTYPERYQDVALPLLIATNQQARHWEAVAAARVDPSALSTTTDGSPYAVSEYEKLMYYRWLGATAPALLYRSDLRTHPFPMPPHSPPAKRHTYGNGALRDVWDIDTHRQVDEIIRVRGIGIQEMQMVTVGPDDEEMWQPWDKTPVIWVTVAPGSATAEAAHEAGEDILAFLEEKGVLRGEVTVEWRESYVRCWGTFENYVGIR